MWLWGGSTTPWFAPKARSSLDHQADQKVIAFNRSHLPEWCWCRCTNQKAYKRIQNPAWALTPCKTLTSVQMYWDCTAIGLHNVVQIWTTLYLFGSKLCLQIKNEKNGTCVCIQLPLKNTLTAFAAIAAANLQICFMHLIVWGGKQKKGLTQDPIHAKTTSLTSNRLYPRILLLPPPHRLFY